jgi:hypothetical protein
MIKIIISIRHASTSNAPLLPLPPPRYCCIQNTLLLQLKLCFGQAAASTTKLATTIVLPPPSPLPMRSNCCATTAYKINKKVTLLTNLFFTTMVTTVRINNCGATRQQRWQCCYLQLPRIALMLRSDEREASSHIENKYEMTDHTDTLKILIIQLLLE